MIHSVKRKYPVGSNPGFLKAGHVRRVTSCVLALATFLALSLLGHGFGAESPAPPSGQPTQIWSKVNYDSKLTDPFFESNEWSYPDYNLEGIPLDKRPKEPPRLKHTAKCFSNSFLQKEHLIKFCDARLLDANMIDLDIHKSGAAFVETLNVQVRNGMVSCKYYGLTDVPLPKGLRWTAKRQELTLDKKVYRKGDVIKGKVYFELLQEMTDPQYVEKYGSTPKTIKIYGVFKTIVE